MDNLFIVLGNFPDSTGLIYITFRINTTADEKRKQLQKFLQAIEFRKYPKDRLIFVIDQARTDRFWTVIWIAPPGVEFPCSDNCEIIKGKDFR